MTMKFKKYFFMVFITLFLMLPEMALSASAPKKPATAAEVALYNGSDRQQVLEEGAKKEGKLTFYTTGILVQTVRPIVDAFQKKYPYIKVEVWRAGTQELLPRFQQEFSAGKYTADVIELTQAGGVMLQEASLLQPFYSSELASVEEGAVSKGPTGAFTAGHYQSGISLGYNTKLLKKDEVPKTYQDLLNPKWKGKIAMAGSNTGTSWIGAALETYGEGFIEKFAGQKITVHQVSARALLDMIISGEILMSPTILDSHVNKSKKEGAPCDWAPLEPVAAYIGQIMLPKNSPHPNAAMLFIDFDLSYQGGQLYVANGYNSPRKDIAVERNYKKFYGPWSTKQEKKWSDTFQKYFLTP
jgi:iron(III) transport system substrate-binding protein